MECTELKMNGAKCSVLKSVGMMGTNVDFRALHYTIISPSNINQEKSIKGLLADYAI